MINELRILVANEPRSYREAIAGVFEALKPHAQVRVAEQEELEREVERFAPHLLICSSLTPEVEVAVLAWVELYPGHGPSSRVSLGGEHWTVAGMELTDLLSILDRVEDLLAREEIGQAQQPESPLHKGELQFRRLLGKLPVGAYTCDPEGLITYTPPPAGSRRRARYGGAGRG